VVLEHILELHNVFVSKAAMNLDLSLKLEIGNVTSTILEILEKSAETKRDDP
jgi:hypothetical protein